MNRCTLDFCRCSLELPGMTICSRFIMPPMATSSSDDEGQVTEKLLNYYEEKTRGGYFGFVITEHSYVSPEGIASKRQLSICRDENVPGLKRLVDTIHKNNTKVIAQLNHAGGAGHGGLGVTPVAPSEAAFLGEEKGHVLAKEELPRIVDCFAQAAHRAKEAGFDGVEIHSAHRYLLNQFYSPLTNVRTDAYGGSLENRVHLHLEILSAVRQVIGPDKALLLRLGALDYMPGGSTIEDALEAAKLFEKNGLDLLDVSGGMSGYIIKGRESWQGYYVPETERLKQELSIPVLMTGGITDPLAAEEILKNGQADLIGVGRAVLKDSAWIKKAMYQGEKDE